MKVRFWGTRGSLAKPGPGTLRYGGNTSCIQVESASGTLVLIDCGTGAHALGQKLLAEAKGPLAGHILISHTHWDHIQGIPFFAPLFVPGNRWDFYAARGFGESLQETLAGQMEYTYFPITLDALNADVHYHHLVEGTFHVGDITVHTRYLNHPALTLGFRLECDGVAIVYACDHEPHSRELAVNEGDIVGQDRGHAEFLRNADLVIHDAQYTAAEYPQKVGWGHSTGEYAIRLCQDVGVKRLALTHHDPLRDDDAVDRMLLMLRAGIDPQGTPIDVFAAAEGQILDLVGDPDQPHSMSEAGASALQQVGTDLHKVALLGIDDPELSKQIADAVAGDHVELHVARDGASVLRLFRALHPALVILDQKLADVEGVALCRTLRNTDDDDAYAREVPVIVITRRARPSADLAAGVTDWLQRPFSPEYIRTRVRAWLMRTHSRWVRPAVPSNEPQRLAALHALRLLDTPAEERFDRYTRLAAALFNVPAVLISLVDEHRQWFKSCFGMEASETSRDISFCAHAIHRRDIMVVPDTLQDDRFAGNPVVVDGPRVRFYAGCPLFLPDGNCVGTLCIVDQRPRQLSGDEAQLLRDLGSLVERELREKAA